MKIGKPTDVTNRTDWTVQAEDLLSRPLIISLLLAVATLMVYWPARKFDFLGYDDPLYFTQNVHVLSGLTWSNVGWAFTTGDAANWHPLTWLSLMLDAELFGNQPAGPHLVNLLFHAANTILVFVLFRRLTAAHWRSALVAALFAWHPLHVESVAWVAERKDLLCAFFMLLTLLAYAKSVTRDERVTQERPAASLVPLPSSRYYFLALFFFALALMSKPMAVTLPFVLLLLDWWPLQRFNTSTRQRLALEKIPFLALSVAAALITFIVQKKGDTVASLATFSLSARIENAFVSYARYLGKTIWPVTLANPYPHPGHWPAATVSLTFLLFVVLCAAAFLLARKFPFVFTGWFWFFGMLVPVIGLVQVGTQAMADRYMYLPALGLFLLFIWGAAQLAACLKIVKPILTALALVVLAGCALKTRAQLAFWQNDGTLFRHALAVTQNNCTASVNFGTWLSKNGHDQAALAYLDAALKMSPSNPLVLYDVGNALAGLGKFDEAIGDYRRALQFAPGRPNILNNLGCALMAENQLPGAITNFEAALKARPDFAYAHNSLGTALFKQGKFEAAAQHFDAAVKLAPRNAQFIANLGDTLVRVGKTQAAAACYRRALELDPGNSEFLDKLNSLRTNAVN